MGSAAMVGATPFKCVSIQGHNSGGTLLEGCVWLPLSVFIILYLNGLHLEMWLGVPCAGLQPWVVRQYAVNRVCQYAGAYFG